MAIDSVFSSEDAAGNGELICRGAAEFLSRTYLDSDRIGKVVYRYM